VADTLARADADAGGRERGRLRAGTRASGVAAGAARAQAGLVEFGGHTLIFEHANLLSAPIKLPNARDKVWGAGTRGAHVAANGGQLSFADRKSWGGPRAGAGREAARRANVRHRVRPKHRWYEPVHVTMRRAKGLPGLRSEVIYNELREAVRLTRRDDFRIVEYSVQRDHVHMLVEAYDSAALAAGMKSFAVRAARRINKNALRRRGSVWGDRYHRRDLGSPRDVRNAVVYVMNNHLKHHEWEDGLVDPFSSAPWFEAWMHKPDPPADPCPVERARTWLMRGGWHGNVRFLHRGELPRALRAPARLFY
jgi:putative transposase